MLAAYRNFAQFHGSSDRELLAWLRQILVSCVQHAVEIHLKAKKRDVRREFPLDRLGTARDHSLANVAQMLADRCDSPSASLERHDRTAALADKLAELKPIYRDVIVLRDLQGCSFAEIADRMDRTPGAARMLWLRAMGQFKQIYTPLD
jgi:RNA polymerase sigma-70 factor, ECF subfamily